MEEKNSNNSLSFTAIRSKHTKIILMSYLPIKRLFTLIRYSKQYQEIIKLSLDDYKLIYNIQNKTNKSTSVDSNESLRELNIKLRLMIEDNALNYNTLNYQTLFELSTHQISSVLLLKDNRIVLGTTKGKMLLSTSSISSPSLSFDDIIDAHKAIITSLIQLGSNNIVSGSLDKDIKLWNINKLEVIYVFELSKPVHSLVEFSSEFIIVGTNELIVLDTSNLVLSHIVKEHYGTVYSLFKANQNRLIIGSSKLNIISFCNKKALLYDNHKYDISLYQGNVFAIRAVLLLKGNQIASAEDSQVTIWDIKFGKYLHKLKGHTKSIYTLEMINDISFASGGDDCMIIIWNINDFNKSKLIYTCFTSCIIKIIYTKDKDLIAFCKEGKIIRFKEDKGNDESDGSIYDYFTEDKKIKKLIKINHSNQLKIFP